VRQIDNIFQHCTAGYGDVAAIRRFWKSLGWKSDGYHFFIYLDGTVEKLNPISKITNGVLGFNANSVHIATQGGVDPKNHKIALDTRTEEQKASQILCLTDVFEELKNYQPINHILIPGHRDASPDRNGNGIIESWERIKECPSYDAPEEFGWMLGKKAIASKKLVWKPGEYRL
jgi:N-acetylmuramoyl-L-alanine amidase